MTNDELERRCRRVDALVAMLAEEFDDIGLAETSRIRRQFERWAAKFREVLTFFTNEWDAGRERCRRCHGRGSTPIDMGRNVHRLRR